MDSACIHVLRNFDEVTPFKKAKSITDDTAHRPAVKYVDLILKMLLVLFHY